MNKLVEIHYCLENREYVKVFEYISQYGDVSDKQLNDKIDQFLNKYGEVIKTKSEFITNYQLKTQFYIEANDILHKLREYTLALIKVKISKGKTREALNRLLFFTKKYDRKINTKLIVLSGQYEKFKKEKLAGLLKDDSILNKINYKLINICDQLLDAKLKQVDTNYSKASIVFFKIFLICWILGFSIGLLCGKYNSPNFNSQSSVELYLAKKLTYSSNKSKKDSEKMISTLLLGEFYANYSGVGNFNPYDTPSVDTSFSDVSIKNQFIWFHNKVQKAKIKCGGKIYMYDFNNGQVAEKWDANEIIDTNIRNRKISRENWVEMLAFLGIIGSYNEISKIKLRKFTKGRYIIGSIIGTISGFGIGYVLTYDTKLDCDNELFKSLISDHEFWASVLNFNVFHLENGCQIAIPKGFDKSWIEDYFIEQKLDYIFKRNICD